MFTAPWALVLLPLVLLARGGLRRLALALLVLAAAGPRLPVVPGLTVVMLDASPSSRPSLVPALRRFRVGGPVRYLAFAERAVWVQNPYALPPLGEATDFAAALGEAVRPGPVRILLLSDGLFAPSASPVPLFVYPLSPAPHAAITALFAPLAPTLGERVEVVAEVFLARPAEATLRFSAGDQREERRLALPRGVSRVGFRFVLEGPTEVEATLSTPLGSDTRRLELRPAGKREVLVLGDASAARYLEAQGFAVQTADRLPEKLPRVVVVGRSADALGPLAAERLERHLEAGGGLLFTATPEGLFFGGWDRAFPDLPLKPRPGKGAAFVLVLDVSGSMAGEKLARAVEGALAAVRAAREEDALGIVVFSDRTRWLLPLAPVDYRQRRLAEERLKALTAGGGTDLAPALATARAALAGVPAEQKAMLVVTDGVTARPDAARREAAKALAAGIRLAALGIGPDADRAFLASLGGEVLSAQGAAALAGRIEAAAKEALRRQSALGRFPLTLRPHPVTRGLDPPPPARVLLPAVKKPWATAVVRSGDLDVLALAERENGRVAALATDLGQSLKDWPDTPRLLANLVRWLADTPARPRYLLAGDTLYLFGRYDAPPVLWVGGRRYPLVPDAPFRYRLKLPPGARELVVRVGDRALFRIRREPALEWPDQDGRATLRRLAEASGGRLLAAPELGPPPRVPRDLSRPLAALALLVFLLERFLVWRRGRVD